MKLKSIPIDQLARAVAATIEKDQTANTEHDYDPHHVHDMMILETDPDRADREYQTTLDICDKNTLAKLWPLYCESTESPIPRAEFEKRYGPVVTALNTATILSDCLGHGTRLLQFERVAPEFFRKVVNALCEIMPSAKHIRALNLAGWEDHLKTCTSCQKGREVWLNNQAARETGQHP